MKITALDKTSPVSISHNPNLLKQVIAKKGDIPHVTQIAHFSLKPGDSVPAHAHPDLNEIFYVETGNGVVTINNKNRAIKSGDVLTIEPGESHGFKNTGSHDLKMFYFGVEN